MPSNAVLNAPQTQISTVTAFVAQGIEALTHDEHPDYDDQGNLIAGDIHSMVHKTRANIDQIISDPDGFIVLKLDDGTEWSIVIEQRS